jgi:signal transduction histidine kinase/CheY-like chemotaxis protein
MLVIAIGILGFAGFLSWYSINHETKALRTELNERITALGNNLSYNSEYYARILQKEELSKLTAGILKQKDVVYARIEDLKGIILAESKNELPTGATEEITIPIISYKSLEGEEGDLVLGTNTPRQKESIGLIRLGYSLNSFNKQINNLQTTILLIVFITFVLVILLLFVMMKIWFISPVQKLVLTTQKIAQGDWDAKTNITSKDEMGVLGKAVDKMTTELKGSRKQLEEYSYTLEQKVAERTKELKESQSKLIQSEKMSAIGQLAGGIAHDFNNILFAITGNIELMKLDLTTGSDLYHLAETIEKSARKAASLTKELLTFAKSSKTDTVILNINDTIHEVVNLLERTVEKTIAIKTKLAPDLYSINADATQIYQVILNICINAKDAIMPHGKGELIIETQNMNFSKEDSSFHPNAQIGKYISITISDTGIGMNEHTIRCIFDPFFTTKDKSKGCGLGLAVTYGIIKNHNGFITVYSEEGKGACFKVYLPAVGQQAAEQEPIKDEKVMVKGEGTILLADDDDSIRKMVKSMLERFGYQVIPASNGKEASELYQQRKDRIDMVILDMVMPGWSGVETLTALKKVNPKIKVLISSGYSSEIANEEIINLGINGFVQKPYIIKELLTEMKKVLEKR